MSSINLRNANEDAEFVDLHTIKSNGKMVLMRENSTLYCLEGKGTHSIQVRRIRSSYLAFGVGTMLFVRIAAHADILGKTFNTAPKKILLISETREKKLVRMLNRGLKTFGGMIKTVKKQKPYYHGNRLLGEIIEETFYVY